MGGDQQTLKFASPSAQYVFSCKSPAPRPQAPWFHVGCFLWWGISVQSPVSQKPSLGSLVGVGTLTQLAKPEDMVRHFSLSPRWFVSQSRSPSPWHYLEPGTDATTMLVDARVWWCSGSGEMVKTASMFDFGFRDVLCLSATNWLCLAWCDYELVCHSHPHDLIILILLLSPLNAPFLSL